MTPINAFALLAVGAACGVIIAGVIVPSARRFRRRRGRDLATTHIELELAADDRALRSACVDAADRLATIGRSRRYRRATDPELGDRAGLTRRGRRGDAPRRRGILYLDGVELGRLQGAEIVIDPSTPAGEGLEPAGELVVGLTEDGQAALGHWIADRHDLIEELTRPDAPVLEIHGGLDPETSCCDGHGPDGGLAFLDPCDLDLPATSTLRSARRRSR